MVNEEIVTALRNAIDRGETLESAANILIISGYNDKEVIEASQFVPNIFSSQQINNQKTQSTPEIFNQEPHQQVGYQESLSNNQANQPLNTENKGSYKKEIILVVILIILIGILASTIFFKNQILEFISTNLIKRFS